MTESRWRQASQGIAHEAANELMGAVSDVGSPIDAGIFANQSALTAAFLEAAEICVQRKQLDGMLAEHGVFDRRGLETYAVAEVRKIQDKRPDAKHGFVVILVDLDGLKRINDEAGHSAGDFALDALAESLRACVRQSDPIGRIGGDELVALIPLDPNMGSNIQEDIQRLMVDGTNDGGQNKSARGETVLKLSRLLEKKRASAKEIYKNWPADTATKHFGQASVGWYYVSAEKYIEMHKQYSQSDRVGGFVSVLAREADFHMYQSKNGNEELSVVL